MNSFIPSNNYESLEEQDSLEDILNSIYKQINIIKNHSYFNHENSHFELEFRLRRKYVNINLNKFIDDNACQYSEYSYSENKTTRYRIIGHSIYPYIKNEKEETTTEENALNEFQYTDLSNLFNYLKNNENIEITNSLNHHIEYTKKLTLVTFYYFIFKISLSIEVSLDSTSIKHHLKNENKMEVVNENENENEIEDFNVNKSETKDFNESENEIEDTIQNEIEKENVVGNENINHNEVNNRCINNLKNKDMNKKYKELSISILKYITPIIKKRRSFLIKNDVRIDMTVFEDKSQFEIDFSKNIYQKKKDIIDIVHTIMLSLDCSNFILDYLFSLVPNFEFQKPITPSLDILYKEAKNLIENTFYVAAKTDGFRRLIIVINNLMFSISETFHVEYICQIKSNINIVFDCEYIDDVFIPFDIIYYNDDLRNKSYSERIGILNTLNFQEFNHKIVQKNIIQCSSFQDLQIISNTLTKNDNKLIPNDGIIITDGQSSYYDNVKVYKIKTINTVDLRFDGRYFYAKQHLIKKSNLNLTLSEYKKICQLYNKHKKYVKQQNNKNNFYYQKQVEIINDIPIKKRVVQYHLVREKKIPFIIEINLDTKTFVKERKDKYTSNSIYTFNSILIASYQKINIEIFSPSSTTLMRKYHNIIKQNILNKYKGNLLDIGTGNGGDIHKWKHFRKIVCVEPDHEKIKILKERISKSEIKNRISIIQNTIQNIKLKNIYNVATCFFALNDFTYTNISNMLKNIYKNISGIFSAIFFDYNLFTENIDSSSIIYKKCINSKNGNYINIIDKTSPIYLLSSLRYAHLECDNIMYINITNSYILNHYECGINSDHVKEIFEKFGFRVLNEYTIDSFPFLEKSQILYTSNIKVIEFSNINN
ncbi:hypothetical protein BCR32DRAFT_285619 [Anaeromyces robustus]|uniref:Methyltransferase domain-containing protein n=1 Tax=Anaeromyces robustus TaxID=1754192 RepID=A0A1Y1WIU0_9FUNG|nr:hypothetical protein BCR32DRAFT_285619 [Anaeromyces robustus]|eukprot:ORX73459.1 hypothetical protein BCR32DRAFT_285619 [Anaeromyces robustus]